TRDHGLPRHHRPQFHRALAADQSPAADRPAVQRHRDAGRHQWPGAGEPYTRAPAGTAHPARQRLQQCPAEGHPDLSAAAQALHLRETGRRVARVALASLAFAARIAVWSWFSTTKDEPWPPKPAAYGSRLTSPF